LNKTHINLLNEHHKAFSLILK